MSVLLETSCGDLVVDLLIDEAPLASKNFLKLCKLKYYNSCLFFSVQANFLAQTGDPTGTGRGGTSVFGFLGSSSSFKDEICFERKLDRVGLLGMSHAPNAVDANESQFFVTLRGTDLEQLHGKHTIFAVVAEGIEVLETINGLYCDAEGRPYQDVRIKNTIILDDPFDDLEGMPVVAPSTPERRVPEQELVKPRIAYEESLFEDGSSSHAAASNATAAGTGPDIDASIKRKEAQSRAIVLEMTGDLPDADVKPPAEVLFVCKLNPVTTDADLELIFSRFGTIVECCIMRDNKTGDSLNYAFVEFETEESCLRAYEKMNNVLIDDRRIKVDFSQSVSKLWNRYRLRNKNGSGQSVVSYSSLTSKTVKGPLSHPIPTLVPAPASAGSNEDTDDVKGTGINRDNERGRDRERKSRSRSRSRERWRERRDDDDSRRIGDSRRRYSDRGRYRDQDRDKRRGDSRGRDDDSWGRSRSRGRTSKDSRDRDNGRRRRDSRDRDSRDRDSRDSRDRDTGRESDRRHR